MYSSIITRWTKVTSQVNTVGRKRFGRTPQMQNMQQHKQNPLPVCRFYASSACKYGDLCKFYHPKLSAQSQLSATDISKNSPVEERSAASAVSRQTPTALNLGMFMKPVKPRPPVPRPEPLKRTPTDLLQVNIFLIYGWIGLHPTIQCIILSRAYW